MLHKEESEASVAPTVKEAICRMNSSAQREGKDSNFARAFFQGRCWFLHFSKCRLSRQKGKQGWFDSVPACRNVSTAGSSQSLSRYLWSNLSVLLSAHTIGSFQGFVWNCWNCYNREVPPPTHTFCILRIMQGRQGCKRLYLNSDLDCISSTRLGRRSSCTLYILQRDGATTVIFKERWKGAQPKCFNVHFLKFSSKLPLHYN